MLDATPCADHSLLQDPAFAAALTLCDHAPLRLPGGEVLLLRRFMGLRVAMLARAKPPPNLSHAMAQLGLHRVPLILSPEDPCALPRTLRLRKPQQVARLSLDGGRDACRARLHPKWRNQLKKAEQNTIKVTLNRLPGDASHDLLRKEHDQGRARGYRNWPPALTAAFAAAAPDQTLLLEAQHGGTTVAQMLFLMHGRRASYHIGHTTDAGKPLAAHNLLLWRGMRKLARLGIRQLDLGILHDATPDLNRFKLRSGATATKTGGTHLYWHPLKRA